MYFWTGWYDGRAECEPPEPGKFWLTVTDEENNEICVIVYRPTGKDIGIFEAKGYTDASVERERRASLIVDALNLHEQMAEVFVDD